MTGERKGRLDTSNIRNGMELCIVCGLLLLEMTKGVGRQEGVEAGAVWTFCRQQLGAVETHGGIRSVRRT